MKFQAVNQTSDSSNYDYSREYSNYIHSFHVQQKNVSRHFVYCKLCKKYPDIVRRYCDNKKLPSITSEAGIRFKKDNVEHHFSSTYHRKCKEAERLSTKETSTINENRALIDVHISEANRDKANHIGELLLQVYCDAKKLTLSAYSWPSRYVAAKAGQCFDFNTTTTTIPSTINIQYVNPSSHLDLLNVITRSFDSLFKEKISSSLACSIHVDGSVDRTQIDKMYILLKIINKSGELETLFIGIGQQIKRGAIGLFEAVKQGIIDNIGEELYTLIMARVSSICTDGANVNTGEKRSLWKFFGDECSKYRENLPLQKFWCSAHRMELVWNDLANGTKEVRKTLEIISSIASYFHESGLRSEELKSIAHERGVKVLSIPKIFKIRWSEWTFSSVVNLLKSWNALMIYFDKNKKDGKVLGFLTFLSKLENMKLIVFLADILHVYKRFHKLVQSDNLTIVSLVNYIELLTVQLNKLQNDDLPGGWVEQFKKSVVERECRTFLKGFELLTTSDTRSTGTKYFYEIRDDVLKLLNDCIQNRFQLDQEIIKTVKPFIELKENADIRQIHEIFGADLPLLSLSLEYTELLQLKHDENSNLSKRIKTLLRSDNSSDYKCVITILSRINACTPQSADVERSIKANNLLKTAFRNRLNLTTENKYMYIYFNMPSMEKWHPNNAILIWLNDKKRRAHTDVIQKDSAKKNSWFKGTFELASVSNSDDEEEDVTVETNEKHISF